MAAVNFCGALGCEKSTTETEGILFYPIPDLKTDKARRDKWIEILHLPAGENQDIRVCQIHFNENQFRNQGRRIRLKRDAIPQPFLIEQEVKTEPEAWNILSQPTLEDSHEQDTEPQFIPTSILMKDLRVCIERLPNSSPTSRVEEIEKTPLAINVSSSSKSIPQPGCVLCKNQSVLRSEHCDNFNETVGNFEDLKIFLCTILKLELRHFIDFPFCKKCTRRLHELHTTYLFLRVQQLKFEKQIEELKQDFTKTFLKNHPTISKLKFNKSGEKYIATILQKWNRSKCFQTTTEQRESNVTPVYNQIPIITPPLGQQQKPSTFTLTVNSESQYNMDNAIENKMHELEYNTHDSCEPNEGNDSDVDELEQRPAQNSSADDLENERVEVQSNSTQIENMFEDSSFLSSFNQPAEKCEPKMNVENGDDPSLDEMSSEVFGNDKKKLMKLDDDMRKLKKRIQNRGYRKPSKCPVCSAVRQGAGALAAHMRIHTGEKPHQCSDCGKAFAHLASYLRHQKLLHGYKRNNSAMDRNNYFVNKNRLYNCDACSHFKIYTKTPYLRHIKNCHLNKEIMDGDTIWFHYCDSPNCTISFSNPENLKNHLLEDHHQNDHDVLNKCDVCLRVFCLKENLEIHNTCHSSVDNVYPCRYCYMVFTTEEVLAQHIPRHKIEFSLSLFCHLCEMCGQGFLSMDNLGNHKTHCKQQNANLKVGNRSIKEVATRTLQKKSQHSKSKWPIITCEFCGKGIVSCHIKQHRFIHTHPEGFECNVCHKIKINPAALKIHKIKAHSNGAKSVCNFCQRCFSDARLLKMHLIKQHPEEYLQGKVHCISCLQLFDTVESMNVHFQEQHPDKICPENGCGKKSATTKALLKHRRGVHLGNQNNDSKINANSYWKINNRLYNCDVCISKFYTKIRYLRHIKDNHVNQGINDKAIIWFHYCDDHDCKKSFSSIKNLKNHFVEDHDQEYSDLNECDGCLRVFCLKENLLVHKTSHLSVETFFPCGYCCMVFTAEEDLNEHTPKHKIEFNLAQYCHICEFCGEGFKSMINLRIHKRSKSGTSCRTPKRVKQTSLREESHSKIKQARRKKKPKSSYRKNKK